MSKKIIISDKRKANSKFDGSLSFLTNRYGGSFFSIYKSEIIGQRESGIIISDTYTDPGTLYEITDKEYNRIEDSLLKIKKHNIVFL